MDTKTVKLIFDDIDGLAADFESNLKHGGTFVRGARGFDENDAVELCIVHPESGDELRFDATVVWVVTEGEGAGVGVAIRDFGPDTRASIEAFLKQPARASTPPGPRASTPPKNMHERLRGLSGPEQQKVAKGGDMSARVVLERIYGKMVWESILRNPRVTVPEVARIAKMGSLPKHLFDVIGANSAFLRVPQVRRALLGNPKTPVTLVDKILRLTPRSELRLIPRQTTYTRIVRDRARRMLARS